jgi:hypothetical protein
MPFEYLFPRGFLCLGVEPVRDFEAKGKDAQARDKESGLPVWAIRGLDLDPEASRFGRKAEVVVKVAAEYQPVPPASAVPGYPPAVEFDGVTVTPYVDQNACTGKNSPHRCRARQAWSIRAAAMRAPENDGQSSMAAA